jgi:tryptophan halogenase
VSVCLGQHLVPEDIAPLVDALDSDRVAAAMEQLRRGYQETASQMPTHGAFLSRCLQGLRQAPS